VPALRALGAAATLVAQPRIGALLAALGVVGEAQPFDGFGLDALFTDAPVDDDAPLARDLARAGRVVCWFGARDPHFVTRLRALAPGAVVAPPAGPPAVVWRHLLASVAGRRGEGDGPSDGDGDCAPVRVSAHLRDDGGARLRAAGWDGASRVLVVHPGAGGVAKRWPVAGFAAAVAEIDATVVVHEGPADHDAVAAFVAAARCPVVCVVDPPLPALAGLLAAARGYLGNDSGVSHLAAAVGTPSVVLFAETNRPWVPWSATARCRTVRMDALLDADRAAVRAAVRAIL